MSSLLSAPCLHVFPRRLAPVIGAVFRSSSSQKRSVDLPDFNTDVDVHTHRLKRPERPPPSPARHRWVGLEGLRERTELQSSPMIFSLLPLLGGAPELNPQFRYLAAGGSALGKKVLDRCNLTVLLEPGQEDLPDFLTQHRVSVVASLPCYSAKNVNMQRGKGVFDKSIQALLLLNQRGYGKPGTGLELDLVYNPLGGFLPPPQHELEDKYRQELWDTFGIEFNKLYTVTNMPIKRFADFLYRRNELQDYMNLLVGNFNPMSVKGLMCRNLLSVNWDGRLYDCDFNQQLDLTIPRTRLGLSAKKPTKEGPSAMHPDLKTKGLSVYDITSTDDLLGSRVVTDNHCYGCTAGMGSS
ncbi:PREDICTED: uncharacterized protein LOC109488133 [Branchiostoma belcheri]|uniref:Uncharacterized protein LOC109488133 n=1 Tax=Branchiostoma belcheri TaxID=7741 RepID=A0A6P5ADP6_BRABE|nr:PREDICTED: uncharacterized protein LOC109488133 [Branchiostoma belcheri]